MKIQTLVLAAAVTLIAQSGFAGDAKLGATVFKKCMACHSVTEPVNKVGPSLMGIVGRPVASVEGYEYSAGMKAFGEGKVWDEAELAAYLPKPRDLVKGTKMAFAGLSKPEDIENLIAFLKDPASGK